LHIANNSKINKITIIDSVGKVVLILSAYSNEINIECLSSGIYLIEFSIDNEKIYRKFVKE
jgi:hypothetical protein